MVSHGHEHRDRHSHDKSRHHNRHFTYADVCFVGRLAFHKPEFLHHACCPRHLLHVYVILAGASKAPPNGQSLPEAARPRLHSMRAFLKVEPPGNSPE